MGCMQDKLQLDKDKAPPSGGRLRAIADTVIGNLQLSITNVHIRFEVSQLFLPVPVLYMCAELCNLIMLFVWL